MSKAPPTLDPAGVAAALPTANEGVQFTTAHSILGTMDTSREHSLAVAGSATFPTLSPGTSDAAVTSPSSSGAAAVMLGQARAASTSLGSSRLALAPGRVFPSSMTGARKTKKVCI